MRGAEKLAATLAGHRAEAVLYRTLATLRLDVPLKESLEELEWTGAVHEAWSAWCTAAGIEKFADRPKRWA